MRGKEKRAAKQQDRPEQPPQCSFAGNSNFRHTNTVHFNSPNSQVVPLPLGVLLNFYLAKALGVRVQLREHSFELVDINV